MDKCKLAQNFLKAILSEVKEFKGPNFHENALEVLNPADGQCIVTIPTHNGERVSKCIDAAHRAQPSWAGLGFAKRRRILDKWCDMVRAEKDALAALLTWEQGKPFSESVAEVNATIGNISWSAERCGDSYSREEPSHLSDATNIMEYEAVGVVAAITPWNFPNAMVSRKAAPALAAGCAVVLKPAEDTPLSALALAFLAHKAGIPRDIFSVIVLGREHAPLFTQIAFKTPKVAMASFTGSTAVGKSLIEASAQNVTKLSLELGGNAPFIIRADADLDIAVEAAFASKFRNAGQTCICANRIYIHGDIYDQFTAKFTARISRAVLGDGFDEAVEIGPLINDRALQRLTAFKEQLDLQGAKSIPLQSPKGKMGALSFKPLVYECDSRITAPRQEIFGPIACLYRYSDDDAVVDLANKTEYGLAAYVYGGDSEAVLQFARRLRFGMVGINEVRIADASIPFGGVKQSGIGREGGYDSLKNFMNLKYFCQRKVVCNV